MTELLKPNVHDHFRWQPVLVFGRPVELWPDAKVFDITFGALNIRKLPEMGMPFSSEPKNSVYIFTIRLQWPVRLMGLRFLTPIRFSRW